MKALVTITIASLLLFLVAQASPIPSKDLARANAYIQKLVKKDNTKDFFLEITHADANKGAINSIGVVFADLKQNAYGFKGTANLELKNKMVELIATLQTAATEELTVANSDEVFQFLFLYVSMVNDKGLYNASISQNTLANGKKELLAQLTPASKEAESIEFLKVGITLPVNEGESISLSLHGELNTTGALVGRGQYYITAILNALLTEQEPSPADEKGLEKVIEEIFDYIYTKED